MSVRRIIKLLVLLIIIILIILFISYYLDRTSNIEGNIASTFFKALYTPQFNGEIKYDDQIINFILPEYTYEQRRKENYVTYLTIVSMNSKTAFAKIHDYYYIILPQFGWKFVDQFGSTYMFTNGKINLLSSRQRLMIGIEIITFSIRE